MSEFHRPNTDTQRPTYVASPEETLAISWRYQIEVDSISDLQFSEADERGRVKTAEAPYTFNGEPVFVYIQMVRSERSASGQDHVWVKMRYSHQEPEEAESLLVLTQRDLIFPNDTSSDRSLNEVVDHLNYIADIRSEIAGLGIS